MADLEIHRFLYVPSDRVLAIAQEMGAIPYDIPDVELSHVGDLCSFDSFIAKYRLADPALQRLAVIVRCADTSRLDLAPQCAGLYAISLGLSASFPDDHEMLRHGLIVYDALYAWCAHLQDETHNWPPASYRLPSCSMSTFMFGVLKMNHISWMTGLTAIALAVSASAADIDWTKVDEAIGKKGTDQPGGVHKYSFPRADLEVTVDGVPIKPALALGSWVAFEPAGSGAMFMGDLVLTDAEISPVMQRLIEDGVEITAVHNHLLRTSLPVFYMHVGGHGDPVKLAATVHAALALSKTPLSAPSAAPPVSLDLDTAALDKTLGDKGTASGGIYQFSVPRAEAISEGGMVVPAAMGTAIAINFEPTGGGKAAITGDFVLLGSEVNSVLKTLRQHGIEVTALHSHMIDDSPHLFFMHFWANDDAQKLAQGLRAALDRANIKPAS